MKKFIEAIVRGSAHEVEELLRLPISPETQNTFNRFSTGCWYLQTTFKHMSAMQLAAMHNQAAIIQLLFEAGASLDEGTALHAESPMVCAIRYGHTMALQMLCELGA